MTPRPPGVLALLLGRPKEAYGFSNNVRPRFKAPSFEKTRFRLVGPETTIQIRVRY